LHNSDLFLLQNIHNLVHEVIFAFLDKPDYFLFFHIQTLDGVRFNEKAEVVEVALNKRKDSSRLDPQSSLHRKQLKKILKIMNSL